jgi:hypothetical protein
VWRIVPAVVVLAVGGVANAAPVVVTLEGGAEGDTNVQRVETGPGLDTARVAAGVVRVGGKLDKRDRLWGGGYQVIASVLARAVVDPVASTENVALLTGEARYLHPLEGRSVSVGAGLVAADAVPITDEIGARTFRNLGADALMVMDAGESTHLSLGFGARQFVYKENSEFDWSGVAATARLDSTLWQPSGGTRSVELAVIAGFEARDYESVALANICEPGADVNDGCSAATTRRRRDRVQRVGAEVTWIGRVVAAAGYQVTVIDSTSYGQSLVRHKATASATTTLWKGVYGTLLGQLQIDQYLDGLVIKTDTQRSEFTSLDDENRSSLQLRVGRPVSEAWSIEARGAIWRNLGGDVSEADVSFRRASIYVGAIYSR